MLKKGCALIGDDGKILSVAGIAASEGLPMEEAWKAVTINPAQIMGISDRVGSLKPGKDGDLVIWTADPLTTVGGRAYTTVIDGKVVYQR